MRIRELLQRAVAPVGEAHGSHLAVRGVIAIAALGSCMITVAQPWSAQWLLTAAMFVAALVVIALPDSWAEAILLTVTMINWWLRADGGVDFPLVLLAGCLMIMHLAAALASLAPTRIPLAAEVLQSWVLRSAVAVGATIAFAIAVWLLQSRTIPGLVPVTVIGLIVVPLFGWLVHRGLRSGEPRSD